MIFLESTKTLNKDQINKNFDPVKFTFFIVLMLVMEPQGLINVR